MKTLNTKKICASGVVTLLASTLAFAASADAIGFSGAYDPANFTLTNSNADGLVNTSAPTSIALTGGNNNPTNTPPLLSGFTTYAAVAAATGTVSFDWSYTTADTSLDPSYDYFSYYVNNGIPTQLTDDLGLPNQTGTASFTVIAGDTFGFQSDTWDNLNGAATTTITNFLAPTAVPFEFEATGGFLAVCALMLTKKLLKKRAEEKLK